MPSTIIFSYCKSPAPKLREKELENGFTAPDLFYSFRPNDRIKVIFCLYKPVVMFKEKETAKHGVAITMFHCWHGGIVDDVQRCFCLKPTLLEL